MKTRQVKLSEGVIEKLDALKHPGQTYDGVIREILYQVELLGASLIKPPKPPANDILEKPCRPL